MAFQDASALITTPLMQLWAGFIQHFPGVVAAILILILGYLIGALLGSVVRRLLVRTKVLEIAVKKMNLGKEIQKWDISGFFALIVKWYVFLVFLNPAAQVVTLSGLSGFLADVALWIPNIILAVIIVMAGYILADYIGAKICETRAKKSSLMANAAKAIVWVFVLLVALAQIGIDISVAESTFLIVLSGIMLGFAIAFGLGFKEEARKVMKEFWKKI